MILITGAGGKTGQAIIRILTRANRRVRAFTRMPRDREQGYVPTALEFYHGDLQNDSDVLAAMEGVKAVYHICPNMHPLELNIGQRIISAAKSQRVDHFVYHSVLHPQTESMPHHWQKMQVEGLIFESGLAFTILQPAVYLENLLAYRSMIEHEGVFRMPYPPDTAISMVCLEDVAQVADLIIGNASHYGATYELVGTPPLTPADVARGLSDILHTDISAQEQMLSDWSVRARAAGLHPYAIQALTLMFNYYAHFGFIGNPGVLSWLLNREPTSLMDFLQYQFGNSTNS